MALYSIRNERQFCELPDLLSRGFLGAAPDAAAHPLAAAAPGAIPRSTSAVSGVPTRPHYSATDPDARLARKGPGREAKLSLAGRVLMENRTGLVVDVEMTSPAVTLSGRRLSRCCVATAAGSAGSPVAATRISIPATS